MIFFSGFTTGFFQVYSANSAFFQGGDLKKIRFAGPEIFLRFEIDLDFLRPRFSEIKVQIKRPSLCIMYIYYFYEVLVVKLKKAIKKFNAFHVNLVLITLLGIKKTFKKTYKLNMCDLNTCLKGGGEYHMYPEPTYFQLLVKGSVTFGNFYFRTLACITTFIA